MLLNKPNEIQLEKTIQTMYIHVYQICFNSFLLTHQYYQMKYGLKFCACVMLRVKFQCSNIIYD